MSSLMLTTKDFTKQVKGFFGFAEGKEETFSSFECQLQMINELTETNKKGSKSTQKHVVQMSKEGANGPFVVMFMEDFPREVYNVPRLQVQEIRKLFHSPTGRICVPAGYR